MGAFLSHIIFKTLLLALQLPAASHVFTVTELVVLAVKPIESLQVPSDPTVATPASLPPIYT